MIRFTPFGEPIVHFELLRSGEASRRREVEIPLVDFLALVKVTRTYEELRVAVLDWVPENAAAAQAGE